MSISVFSCNSEHTGLSCIMRKRFVSPIGYAILSVVKRSLEERRERHGYYDRKSLADSRRGSRSAPSQEIYSTQVYQFETARGRQSGRSLSGEARSSRELHSQEQYEQINKASDCWQRTTKNLVAVSLPLTDSAPEKASFSITLPFVSIANLTKKSQWLYMASRGRVESVYILMKRKFNPFAKAIETKFQGHKFRSRGEARWACFFSEAGIEYQYEEEGYALEGTPYLPDFYLPQQDCFIEVKGQEPTEEEEEKARLLTLYTGKTTYIFYEGIKLPHEKNHKGAYGFHPPKLYTTTFDKETLELDTHEVEANQDLLVILQKLQEAQIEIKVKDNQLILHPRSTSWQIGDLDYFAEVIKDQQKVASQIFPILEDYEDDLLEAMTPEEGWETDLLTLHESRGWKWQECTRCGLIIPYIGSNQAHSNCSQNPQGILTKDTPRLIAAYEAVRQARF